MWWLVCQGWLRECCMQDCRAAVWSDTPLVYCSIDCSVLYDLKYSINEAYLQLMGSISLVSISSNKIPSMARIWCLHSLWDDPGASSGPLSPCLQSLAASLSNSYTLKLHENTDTNFYFYSAFVWRAATVQLFHHFLLSANIWKPLWSFSEISSLQCVHEIILSWWWCGNSEVKYFVCLDHQFSALHLTICWPVTSDQCILAWVFNLHNWETYKECRRRQDLSLLYDCVALCGT